MASISFGAAAPSEAVKRASRLIAAQILFLSIHSIFNEILCLVPVVNVAH